MIPKILKLNMAQFVLITLLKKKTNIRNQYSYLPGRGASTPMWVPNLEGLREERPVYTIDLLGEPGMSVQTKMIENQKQQAEWLNEVIEGLGLEKVHIVGVSVGGWTTMNLARYNPEHIASASLLDPVFVFAQMPVKMILASIPASVPIVPKFIREKMLSYVSGEAEANDDEPISKLIESGMSNYKLKTPAPDLFTKEELKNINVPVLALIAEKSTMHDAAKAVETGEKYVKDIDIVNWKNASHAINGEFSNEVNARILDFVEKHSKDN